MKNFVLTAICAILFLLLFPSFQHIYPSLSAFAFMDRQTDCTFQTFSCFANKYGFGTNPQSYSFSKSQLARMAEIKPFAIKATEAYNSIAGHDKVEPQMLVWWAVYDTGGSINYNNCNDEGTPKGYSYNNWNTNCDNTWLWQLGYGAQFSHISILQEGFQSLYGNSNSTTLVQQVGQAVLNFDKTIPTSPLCGGYSCTFPPLTISQILSGTVINNYYTPIQKPLPEDNWWASVLVRDPLLNAYNMADILIVDIINKNAVCSWRGNYCNTWAGAMTNSLATIVNMWNSIPSTGINLPGNPLGNPIGSSGFSSGFADPGGQYYDYYQFANKFLFDGVNFFSTGTTTAGTSGNKVADYANLLYHAILQNCPPIPKPNPYWGSYAVVNRNNYQTCVANLKKSGQLGQFAGAVIQEIKNSFEASGFSTLSCVYFVRAVAAGIGIPLSQDYSKSDTNYQVIRPTYNELTKQYVFQPSDIKIGDIYHSSQDFGHVCVITSIGPGGKGFGCTEANQNGGSRGGQAVAGGSVDITPNINYHYDQYFDYLIRLK